VCVDDKTRPVRQKLDKVTFNQPTDPT